MTEGSKLQMADAPVLVLVAVQDLVNLASCIRIAKNFGIETIRLVQPECDVDFYRIEGIAHNTADLLERITLHDTLDDAFADLAWVVALTGRERTAKRTMMRPRAAAEELVARSAQGKVGILAGREDRGLHNDEIDRCAALVTISANPEYSSLNLAQAWAVMAHETWVARGGDTIEFKTPRHAAQAATHEQLEALFADWETALKSVEFFKKRQPDLVMRGFREIVFRAGLDQRETSLVRAIGLEIGHFLRRRGVLPPLERRRDGVVEAGGAPPPERDAIP